MVGSGQECGTRPERGGGTGSRQESPAVLAERWRAAPGEPTVREVGEIAAIQSFASVLPVSAERLLGPGDDAAVVAAPDARVVATSDSLIEGPDFRLELSTPYDLGWKLAAVNLADVAAMGARPTALIVSLGVPPELPVRALTELAEGLRDACLRFAPGCGVEGGDLATSPVITAVAAALGSLDGRAPVRRSGARPGDIVAVAGELGPAADGLRRLFAGERPDERPGERPDEQATESLADRSMRLQLRPEPPVAAGVLAAVAGATSMIDVSDGLALDAARVASASGVTFDLDPAVTDVLGAGEDHALLATFPAATELPTAFVHIGWVHPRGAEPLLLDGKPIAAAPGWDPFRDAGGALA